MIKPLTTPRLELWRIDGAFRNEPHVHEDDDQVTIPLEGLCHFTYDNRDYRFGARGNEQGFGGGKGNRRKSKKTNEGMGETCGRKSATSRFWCGTMTRRSNFT